MTATPIPRTLALTLYGDLDVSVLDELPPGRTPIVTEVAPRAQARQRIYEFIRGELQAGRQAYVVCPLVEETGGERSASAATEMAERLRRRPVPRSSGSGLIHGRLGFDDEGRIMRAFKAGELDLLVCDDGDRGRDRRAQRVGDADRARRALRPVPAPPAARPRRPRGRQVALHPARQRPDVRRGRSSASRPWRATQDGFRHRRGRPPDPRPRRVLRDAPVGPAGVPHREPRDPRAAPRRGARRTPRSSSCAIPASASRSIAPFARRCVARWRERLELASIG